MMTNIVLNSISIYNPDKALLFEEIVNLEDAFNHLFLVTEESEDDPETLWGLLEEEITLINNRSPGFEFVIEIIQHEHCQTWMIKGEHASLIELYHVSNFEDETDWDVRNGEWLEEPVRYDMVADIPLSPYPDWYENTESVEV
jgi:hypothetical protein